MKKEEFSANMADFPRLYAFWDGNHFFGAYHLLKFGEQERGRILTITVDSKNLPVCWIEIWHGFYDGKDWVRWTAERGQEAIASSAHKPHPNPVLTWKIEPGDYTIYFANSSAVDKTSDQVITYQIEVN